MDARRHFRGGGGGSGKLTKGPHMEIKVAIKKFPYGEKAPHMVKKAPHKEKNVAKKAPIMEKSGQKAPHIAKKNYGGERTAYSCPPPPPASAYGQRVWHTTKDFRRHRDKKVERIAKKQRAEAASHLTSSPYKAILLAKPASPPPPQKKPQNKLNVT